MRGKFYFFIFLLFFVSLRLASCIHGSMFVLLLLLLEVLLLFCSFCIFTALLGEVSLHVLKEVKDRIELTREEEHLIDRARAFAEMLDMGT